MSTASARPCFTRRLRPSACSTAWTGGSASTPTTWPSCTCGARQCIDLPALFRPMRLRSASRPRGAWMSIRTAEHETSATLRVSLPFCAAAAIYALLLVLGARLLNDPDVYWHVAVGRWIVEHRAFPRVDTFSSTVAGAPWIAKEWLSQLLYAGAHAVAGWSGVVVLAAGAAAAAFALLAYFLLQKLAPLPALTLVGAGFVLAAPHLQARPHALALPLMVAWMGVLINAVDHRRAPPLALLPLMTLWANLHASFTLGLALIAPLAVEAWWNAGATRRA